MVEVSMLKETVLEPAGTVTVAGGLATSLLFVSRVIVAPPVGAAAVSVIVPRAVAWLFTVVGANRQS
jgi:hypothetical protein